MSEYTRVMATLFHGFRIDNCHSTPLHVGQYLLDVARSVNPNLYVVAELFAGSPEKDDIFVFTLGLHSLIREASASWDPHELSRQIHRSGGDPVASVSAKTDYLPPGTGPADDQVYYEMKEYLPHALFTDCTHDNETPTQRLTTADALSTSALVAMSACAVASNRGYDELFPKHLSLPQESGHYPEATTSAGIMPAKKRMLRLHRQLAELHYSEIHVHQDDSIIAVHRVQPTSSKGYFLVANTAFSKKQSQNPGTVTSFRLNRTKLRVDFVAKILVPENQSLDVKREDGAFVGLQAKLSLTEGIEGSLEIVENGGWKELKFIDFPPGSIALFETLPDSEAVQAIDCLRHSLNLGLHRNVGWFAEALSRHCPDARVAVGEMDLTTLNVLLFRCEGEEREFTGGFYGAYSVPNYGALSFCGLQGVVTLLRRIINGNDMGHPLFDNLRTGHWVMDYTVDRLYRYLPSFPQLKDAIQWLEAGFAYVKALPNYLVPRYCTLVIMTMYHFATERAYSLMSEFVQCGREFTRALALGSVQLVGLTRQASLHPIKDLPALAAGLPHFATGFMRTWGRDTFIALRGLMVVTGRFDLAKRHLHSFGSCLRHGLIPNLLDSGRNPRYNCRDAVWWYLQAVQDYCTLSPEGLNFLKSKMERRFPQDDAPASIGPMVSLFSVKDLIQEVLERHANGICYVERNAGPNLDSNMTDSGFEVKVWVDWAETGFVFGGSASNCGTWMDKMGESVKAGNRGVPSTPRDGADIEIVGLLKSTLRWLVNTNFPHGGVEHTVNDQKRYISYKDWDFLVSSTFEKHFYVPKDPSDDHKFVIQQNHVNRRGIYKDTVGSTHGWTDYQLRPNFFVAMVVAPELFSFDKAKGALEIAEKFLVGPLGIKTLDPGDFNYRGNYDNGNDSDDKHVAKGANYHQGPVRSLFLSFFLFSRPLFLWGCRNGCGVWGSSCGHTCASWEMGRPVIP